MKANVAYEGSRKKRRYLPEEGVKPLTWHKQGHQGGLHAKGVKGIYRIEAQKPNRRQGIFKWCLLLDNKPAMLNGQPMSNDELAKLKAEAAIYDRLPQGVPVAVVASETPPAHAGEAYAACGRAGEAPTREEWEVVVTDPPLAHRGHILSMGGPGHAFPAGNKIVIDGFHDDTEASRVAGAIAKQYKVAVTFGPKKAVSVAAEPATAAEAKTSHAFDEHAATELELYADNTSELYNQKLSIIENMRRRIAKGTYDKEKALKLWMYWVDAAAKRYVKEFGGGTWHEVFGTGTRLEVARREEERERAELQVGGTANPLA